MRLLIGIAAAGLSALFVFWWLQGSRSDSFIVLQSTTSTQNSGLYDHILPIFKAETGIDVRVIAVGTGQAISNAERCDGDVLIVHARQLEEDFVAKGYGLGRDDLMRNSFVIVGPNSDAAGIKGGRDPVPAMRAIAQTRSPFLSRADRSGTHIREMEFWDMAGVKPDASQDKWYRETGSGMGATLNMAVTTDAYTLADTGTWISHKNKRDHTVLVADHKLLDNPYSVIVINPDHCPNVRLAMANRFKDWLLSKPGKDAIASFRLDGQQLFFPAPLR